MQQAIDYLITKDKTLNFILDKYGMPNIQKRKEGFAAMCHIILEQQVSIASAKACYIKLENYFSTITPKNILNAKNDELRNCGISRQKIMYLKDLAQKTNAKIIDFKTFTTKNEEQIRKELITIKGVGNWSIEVYLMFCLQSPDIIPLGDIAIKNTMKELYKTETLEEMIALSNNWKPFRTIASYVIWHYYLEKRKGNKTQPNV